MAVIRGRKGASVLALVGLVLITFAVVLFRYSHVHSQWNFNSQGGFYFSVVLAAIFLFGSVMRLRDQLIITNEGIRHVTLLKAYSVPWSEVASIQQVVISFPQFYQTSHAPLALNDKFYLTTTKFLTFVSTTAQRYPSLANVLAKSQLMPETNQRIALLKAYYQRLGNELANHYILLTIPVASQVQAGAAAIRTGGSSGFDDELVWSTLQKYGLGSCRFLEQPLDYSYKEETSELTQAI